MGKSTESIQDRINDHKEDIKENTIKAGGFTQVSSDILRSEIKMAEKAIKDLEAIKFALNHHNHYNH